MSSFNKMVALRKAADRNTDIIRNSAEGDKCLHILWLYPDILHIHGGRGDMMGILHAAELMELPVEIKRHDNLDDKIPFEWADMIFMNSGEIKCVPEIVEAMSKQKDELDEFVSKGGFLCAVASTGAVFAKELHKEDGTVIKGLGLLDMTWKERENVWGDDLCFSVGDVNVMGCQIQVADVYLGEGQAHLGDIIYGRGNCGDGREGARSGNVIFTSCLGPMMVKNPKLAESWLTDAANAAGVPFGRRIADEEINVQTKSYELIDKFIKNKISRQQK